MNNISWHTFQIPFQPNIGTREAEIRDEVFKRASTAYQSLSESGVAVLVREGEDGGSIFFLSPKAAEASKDLIEKYGAETCPPPEKTNDLTHLMGDSSVLQNLD